METLHLALEEWRKILGTENVQTDRQSNEPFHASTIDITRQIPAVLFAKETRQIVKIVQTASRYGVPLYPVSTGHNWGYGTANPVVDGCVLLNLSRMNRIHEFDRDSGVVRVGPGVTQGQLRDYLDRQGEPFMVPVHGGGPDCSLIGNALERGYGITSYADHFSALTSLEAVLPDGEIYRSALTDMKIAEIDGVFKWGIGPYLDGIFTQSNIGIVTQATLALAPQPETSEAFIFSIENTVALEAVIPVLRKLLRKLGSTITSVNLMNTLRVLAMAVPYPSEEVPDGQTIPPSLISSLAEKLDAAAWTGVGAIQGEYEIVCAAKKIIREHLKPFSKKFVFLNRSKIGMIEHVLKWVPKRWTDTFFQRLDTITGFLDIIEGRPNRMPLALAYWKSKFQKRDRSASLDPARDRCGLIWYAPLVPFKPKAVRDYVAMVSRYCLENGINPIITLTTLNDRCFDSTVPILFQRDHEQECINAKRCFETLLKEGKRKGFLPYRVGIDAMHHLVDPEIPFWKLASQIKKQIDPKNIIAPGRYSVVDS